jgi:SPX domain protein involved in polyphosphate accumulation
MVKFTETLKSEMVGEWAHSYLEYEKLKQMIEDLVKSHVGTALDTGKGASLSVQRPTNAAGLPENQSTQEQFFSFIEQEIRKIDLFTKRMVRDIRQVLSECEREAANLQAAPAGSVREVATEALRLKMDKCGEDFLKVTDCQPLPPGGAGPPLA